VKPLRTIRGTVAPLDRADVDTDQIIPARHLKRVDRDGLGRFAFEAWRGKPGFSLDQPRFRDAPILVTGPNFGCGSSREHAPWALQDMGVRVIIAPSFADIFRNNCAKVGILTIELPDDEVAQLMREASAEGGLEVEVDLARQTISGGQKTPRAFEVDPFVKHCLLEGLDAIALSLEQASSIAAHERQRPDFMPTTIDAGERT
jgi:3-isopropylmalate/(R)-2-methylmalate dehydratase small subunit